MFPNEVGIPELSGMDAIPMTERITCSVAEACKATGLGRTKIYSLISEGCLESTTVGRWRLVNVGSLRKLLRPR
jgi:excisionase family DNA binding protein